MHALAKTRSYELATAGAAVTCIAALMAVLSQHSAACIIGLAVILVVLGYGLWTRKRASPLCAVISLTVGVFSLFYGNRVTVGSTPLTLQLAVNINGVPAAGRASVNWANTIGTSVTLVPWNDVPSSHSVFESKAKALKSQTITWLRTQTTWHMDSGVPIVVVVEGRAFAFDPNELFHDKFGNPVGGKVVQSLDLEDYLSRRRRAYSEGVNMRALQEALEAATNGAE